jgi:hypothetical protein
MAQCEQFQFWICFGAFLGFVCVFFFRIFQNCSTENHNHRQVCQVHRSHTWRPACYVGNLEIIRLHESDLVYNFGWDFPSNIAMLSDITLGNIKEI